MNTLLNPRPAQLPLSSTVVLPLDRKRPHTEITGAMQVCTHDASTSVIQAQRSLHASFQLDMSGVGLVTSSSESSLTAKQPFEQRVPFNKNVLVSPQEFFMTMLGSRGYPGKTYCSLKCGYHNSPTLHQTISYGVSLTKAIRSSDIITARSLLASGLHPNACNKFGESIVHTACRRGDYAMLRALIEAQSSVQVTDDFGRTPLHDACWTATPNFDTIRLLLDKDPWLPCILDCRGTAPLGYVRKAHWALWIGFLEAIADRYWPNLNIVGLNDDGGCDDKQRHTIPPLALLEPNTRPLPDPCVEIDMTLEIVEQVANGEIAPQDLNKKQKSNRFD